MNMLASAFMQLPQEPASQEQTSGTQDSIDDSASSETQSQLPEVEAYASLLVLLLLNDAKQWDQVRTPKLSLL